MKLRPITPEQYRILVAAAEGRLHFDSVSYRYKIDGEAPPDRRERERLQKRGMLTRPAAGRPMFTERGLDALGRAPVQAEPPKLEQTDLLSQLPEREVA